MKKNPPLSHIASEGCLQTSQIIKQNLVVPLYRYTIIDFYKILLIKQEIFLLNDELLAQNVDSQVIF